jgi:ubiquinone/menaquinone biosynthesis C-methylase UbiE
MPFPFNAKKTQQFFDNLAVDFSMAKAPRDEIFLERILKKYQQKHKGEIKALDFGCGGGALVLKMLKRGINVWGIEKHKNICGLARERLNKAGYDSAKIVQGSIDELKRLPPASFDFVVLMGVFQYLPPDQIRKLLINVHCLLKPGGHLVGSFQNALFDLFTFNKYTIDFYQEKFFKPLGIDKLFGRGLVKDLKGLITNSDKPAYLATTARDNIYVQTTNPLTIGEELKKYKFNLLQRYFYSFFFVPRIIEKEYKQRLQKLTKRFEIKRSEEWYGHFMANAFVVDCVKEK